MLGLVGILKDAQRVPSLEAGSRLDVEHGSRDDEVMPAAWFRIEVHSAREAQVRHTLSARGAIDLIADLLNEGWNLDRICDRKGQAIDYEDIVHAWMDERPRS